MHRILILDDDQYFAQSLRQRVQGFDEYEKTETDLVITPEDALDRAKSASRLGKPYTIFLIDYRLGPYKDGIETMKELLEINQDSDAVIFTGFENSEDGIRAYEAGARRYISKTSEPREIIFVLKDLAKSRREKQELEYKSTVAAQTSWAAAIAHEINNEVYKIQTSAYLIKKAVEHGSDIYKHAEGIEESAANLTNTGQFRDQAPTSFEVDTDIKSYVVSISQKRSITPRFKLGAHGIRINANRVGFHYIFKQLIDNAARVMKAQEEKKIFIITKLITEGKVEILFRDFGPGIDDNIRLSLFQKPVTTKNSGGYGMLLIRQIIEGMNGKITLKPFRHGYGAEFSIQIPFLNDLPNKDR